MKFAGDAANQFINNLNAENKMQLTETGYYIQERLNEVGDLIKETWSNTFSYTNETFFKLIGKSTWNPAGVLKHKWTKANGQVIEEFWNRAGGITGDGFCEKLGI